MRNCRCVRRTRYADKESIRLVIVKASAAHKPYLPPLNSNDLTVGMIKLPPLPRVFPATPWVALRSITIEALQPISAQQRPRWYEEYMPAWACRLYQQHVASFHQLLNPRSVRASLCRKTRSVSPLCNPSHVVPSVFLGVFRLRLLGNPFPTPVSSILLSHGWQITLFHYLLQLLHVLWIRHTRSLSVLLASGYEVS